MAGTAVLPLDFTWTAPETCPSRTAVVEQLSRAVDAEGKDLPPLTARAVVRQDGAVWRLELFTEMDGRKGARVLEADSCEGLSRAATLVLALTLGEGMARRQAEAAQKTEPPSPPAEPPAPAPPPAPPPPRLLLWAATGAGVDPLGSFGSAFLFGFAYQPSFWTLGARASASLPRTSALLGIDADVRSFGFHLDVDACLAPRFEPIQPLVCVAGGATLLQVEAQGTARDQRASVPLYSLGPSLGARWLLSDHAFLSLGFVSRFFLVRPELVVEGLSARRRVETASFGGELGGGVRW